MNRLLLLVTRLASVLLPTVALADELVQFHHVIVDKQAPNNLHTKSTGDFDGDGLVDLLVAGTGGELVWYQYPDWQKHRIVEGGGGWSTDAEAADIDRDGDVDVVISDWYQNGQVVWFSNPGKGRGDWAQHVIGKPRAHDIELADLDADGDLDVVTRQQGDDGNRLEVWLQRQDGGWRHQSIGCPSGEGLTLSDLDGDGDRDIVLAAHWFETDAGSDLRWTEHRYTTQWRHGACTVKTGDFNLDGRTDVVLCPAEKRGGLYQIAWYEAPPDPRQADWVEHVIDTPVETVFHSLGVADFNSDAQPDVATAEMAQGQDPDQVIVYLGAEKGTRWKKQVVANTSSHAIRVVDVGGDGDFDIFGAKWNESRQVDLWENRGLDSQAGSLPLDRWRYVQVDDQRPSRAFGLALADLTGDQFLDIASGNFFYRNPGDGMTAGWARHTFPVEVDALLAIDVNGNARGDVIGLDTKGQVIWLEGLDRQATKWRANTVGDVARTDHGLSSQGYTWGQIVAGGRPEIVLNVGSIFYFEIPDDPSQSWPRTVIAEQAYPEGVALGDMDGDGDLDLAGTTDNKQVAWWENPGDKKPAWQQHVVGQLPDKYADRFYLRDLNGDRWVDIVVSAANGSYNGVFWWEHPGKSQGPWTLRTVVVQGTTNSMDVADMDADGDIDIISGEHRGEEKVAVWANDGRGEFFEHVVSKGIESHLGTRVADLDMDGDLDIVSIAWDEYRNLHVWRNDAITD